MTRLDKILRLFIAFAGLLCILWFSMLEDAWPATRPLPVWTSPGISGWQDYPFCRKPSWTLHQELWQDFNDLPLWGQRGRIVYISPSRTELHDIQALKDSGAGIIHIGAIKRITPDLTGRLKELDLPLVIRLEGQFFFGRDYTQLMARLRPGGWVSGHVYNANMRWYEKYAPSLAATKILRDGQPIIEYQGSPLAQRRDLSYMHPASIQMRQAYLRETLLGEQVFDRPVDLACGREVAGVFWDNPGNAAVSYDPYSVRYVAREFEKTFDRRLRQRFNEWYDEQWQTSPRFQKKHASPDNKDRLFQGRYEMWYGDPPTLWMLEKDRSIQRWWEKTWADAYAGYYAWQYKYLQREIAPRLKKRHVFVGGNFKFIWSNASWDYYLFAWPTLDLLGPCEGRPVYTNKYAPGFKLALAASNGKPAGLFKLRPGRIQAAEALACLGVVTNEPPGVRRFHVTNMDLYHNARPGARTALLYHLEDGLHHSEIAAISRLCGLIWRAGRALEIITERHLSQRVLRGFDLVILPGFQFTRRDINGLKDYLWQGGRLLLIGDNTDEKGRYLAASLAGLAPWTNGQKPMGQGRLLNIAAQLITPQQMDQALEKLGLLNGCQIVQPARADILLNILKQPEQGLTGIHLVNYTGQPVENLKLRLSDDLHASFLAWISPSGGEQVLKAENGQVIVPSLDIYGVLVACPDPRTQAAVIERNRACRFKAAGRPPAAVKLQGSILQDEKRLETLRPGEKLCHLRSFSKAGYRRVDADLVTRGKARVGRAQKISLDFHKIGIWSSKLVHMDKIALVMVHIQTGERETVPVEMGKRKGAGSSRAEGKSDDLYLPLPTPVLRRSYVYWTPQRPGRYQLYLSYRYAHEAFDGRPDTRGKTRRYQLDDYFFSRPFLKIVYEDKLPGLVVDVEP